MRGEQPEPPCRRANPAATPAPERRSAVRATMRLTVRATRQAIRRVGWSDRGAARRTRYPAVCTAVAVLATAAACVGGAPDPEERDGERDGGLDFAVTDARVVTPAGHVEGALRGGTITVVSGRTPESLDPTRASSDQARSILSLVVRGLTQYQYRDGRAVLVPDMATDLGTPNRNFTRWTFRLRDGLRYEDGTEVKASHVAHAIKRQLATEELPDGFNRGAEYYLGGDTYEGPWESGENFRGVSTPDDQTIVIKLRKPFAELPFFAATPAFAPIPPDEDTKRSYVNKLLATGPYKFEEYVPGNQLVLTLNEQWDPATDTTRRQYVDRFVFRFGQSTRTAQNKVIAEDADAEKAPTTVVPDPVSKKTFERVEDAGAGSRLVRGPAHCVSSAYLDTREIPLEVRQALAVAWPIGPANQAAGKVDQVNWKPARSLLPSATPGRLAYDPTGTKGELGGDPDAARRTLGQAGRLGFELSYYYDGDSEAAEAANEVRVEALEEAGFQVEAIEADHPESAAADPEAEVNIRFSRNCPIWPSGGAFFPSGWATTGAEGDAGTDGQGDGATDGEGDGEGDTGMQLGNLAFLEDPDLTRRIDKISRLPVDRAMVEWGKLDRHLMRTYVPAVPLGEVPGTALVGSKIGNAVVSQVTGMPVYSAMYLKE